MKKSSNGVGSSSSSSSSSSSLAPGFRFHTTDEELVSYYLYRKVRAKPFRFDAISDVEIYKVEPWDLPGLSKLKSRDLEWYFFSVLDKKYGIGCRTNRATAEGYWKTTGKDRSIQHKSRVVGMKKSLVFHRGRAPRGERTNWVMHEYRLVDEELDQKAWIVQDFVLCRIFFKSGTGPMNGEKYGAPFVEEEWDMDDDDDEQNHVVILRLEDSAPPVNFYQGESSNFVQEPTKNGENGLKPLTIVDEGLCVLEANNDKTLINIEMQPETEAIKSDSTAQPPIAVSHSLSDCQPEAQCIDNIDSIDEFFLEANDLLEPIEALPAGAAEFEPENNLTYFDVDDDIAPYLNFDSSELLDPDFTIVHPAVNENLYFGTERPSISNKQPAETNIAEGASASKEFLEVPISKSDSNYPFMKQASQMLGSFHAPPAFASEFPAKDMAARLQAAAAQSSDSVDVSAGMIKIRNSTMNDDSVMPWCFDKSGNFNVLVSFNLPLPEVMVSGTMASVFSRSWFYFFFFGAMALAISAKVGTCIYAK